MTITAPITTESTKEFKPTAATPRIAVFSDSALAGWFDNAIRNLGQDQVVYSRGSSTQTSYFDENRNFWQNMSEDKNTPVLVFVDEEAVENTGGGRRADWSQTYHKLLETLYKATDRFAIVKISPNFTVGDWAIRNQLLFPKVNPTDPLDQVIRDRASAFHARKRNTSVLGLNQGIPTIATFVDKFMREVALLFPNTKPREDIVE